MDHNLPDNRQVKILTARVISRVFEPIFWLPVVIWLMVDQVSLPTSKKLFYYLILAAFGFMLPCGYFMYLVFVRKVFDIDVSDRRKRIGFTLKTMIPFAAAVVVTFFMDWRVFIITATVYLATLCLILTTLVWKISFHGGLNTLIICTLNYLYGWHLWWLFVFLIPIGWARLVLKKHSLSQFAAGVAMCLVIFLSITHLLG